MKALVGFLLVCQVLIAGCAGGMRAVPPQAVFRDDAFQPTQARPRRAEIFAMSEAMQRYLRNDVAATLKEKGAQQGLIEALYSKQQLKIDYDAERTRDAAETFAVRAGNCLSLVIMTAAFAKELGLPVYFQRVRVEEAWTRDADIYFASHHVNVTLGRIAREFRVSGMTDTLLTIDFYPTRQIGHASVWRIEEATIVAMFHNNQAAEALARGNLRDAYWAAREAIVVEPEFAMAYNTLGVIYRRNGLLEAAERALKRALEIESGNLHTMSNLAIVLTEQGRLAEAATLKRAVADARPVPPYHYFDHGMAALRERDFARAREWLQKEVERAPYNGEFHFWLGVALAQLGDPKRAELELALAIENSNTRKAHSLYAAKLGVLQAKGALPLSIGEEVGPSKRDLGVPNATPRATLPPSELRRPIE